ncbi:MAG: hypothetical protein LBQ61_07025, partial [Spirochaetales bacterium]|nr:hypothetical protein [Spirochaetales bacterium]
RGIQKILITCDAGSPLAAHADFILAGVSRETYPEIAGSCVSIATIIDIIYTALEMTDYHRAAEYQEKIQDAGDRFGNKRYEIN